MRAFSTANGGVMFIPDEIERKTKAAPAASYIELVKDEPKLEKPSFVSRLFGKRRKDEDNNQAAAA